MVKLVANYSVVAHDVVGNPIQQEATSDSISGRIEEGTNVFSIYPSANGGWDLRQTPYLTFEFFCDVVVAAGDAIAEGSQNGLNLVARYNGGAQTSPPLDLTDDYGTIIPNGSDDGQWPVWKDNGTSRHKTTVDLRTLIPDLSNVTEFRLWCVRGMYAMNETPMNFYFGNLEVSADAEIFSSSITPTTAVINQGESVPLVAAVAGGTAPYNYVWTVAWDSSSVNVDGNNTPNFTFDSALAELGIYQVYCTVTDADGTSVKSNNAAITVISGVAGETFDSCDSLTPANGIWGTTGDNGVSGGTLSVRTDSPLEGTGYIRNTIPATLYSSWLHKRYDVMDFSAKPIVKFRVRASRAVHAELVIVTATGAYSWETNSVSLPVSLVAGQWVVEEVDLRTLLIGTMNLAAVRSWEIYVDVGYQDLTLDIDWIEIYQGGATINRILTMQPAVGGTTTPMGQAVYPDGSQVTILATAADSYQFSNWIIDGTTVTENPAVFTITKDITVTPVFTAISTTKHTLAISSTPAAAGTTNPTGTQQYNEGSQVQVTAIPAAGNKLQKWVLDGQDVSGATFTLTVTPAVGGTTDPNSSTAYQEGQSVQVVASPNLGYSFVGWMLDSVNIGNSNPISIIMDSNHVLTPIFSGGTPAQGALHVTGNQILDENNNSVFLRGIGMMGLPPQVVVWPPGTRNSSYPWAPSMDILEETFRCHRDYWRSNMIRLFILPEFYWRDNVNVEGQYPVTVSTRDYVRALCEKAKEFGIYVNLVPYTLLSFTEAFASGPYLSEDRFQGLPGVGWNADAQRFFSDQGMSEMQFWNAFWTQVANDLKDLPNVIFEAWNEPQDSDADNTPVPSGFKTYCQTMYNAIRATGATNLIFYQWRLGWYPNGWGNTLDWVAAIHAALGNNPVNVAYTTHWYYYAPSNNAQFWTTDEAFIRDAVQQSIQSMGVNAPLVINEGGSCLYYDSNPVNGSYKWFEIIMRVAKDYTSGFAVYYWAGAATEGGAAQSNLTILTNGGDWPDGAASPTPNTMGQIFINSYTATASAYMAVAAVTEPSVDAFTSIVVTMDTDHVLQAVFVQQTYTLTVTQTTGGSVSPPTASYAPGVTVTLTPNPTTGYRFDHWILDGSNAGSSPTLPVIMNSDHTVQAIFVADIVALTVAAGPNGSVQPSGVQNLTVGQTYTFQANPNTGYVLDYWDIGGVSRGSANPISIAATSSLNAQTLTAHFKPQIVSLIVVADANGSVSPSGIQNLSVGQTYQFAAIPEQNYKVDYWDLNGSNIGSANPISIVAVAALNGQTLTAHFKPSVIQLTVVAGPNGSVNQPGVHQFTIGNQYNFLAMPATAYYLDHWDLGGTNLGSTNPISLTITADMNEKTLTCFFVESPVASVIISVGSGAGGTTDLAGGDHTFHVGDTVSVRAIPDDNHKFKRWIFNGFSYLDNPLELTIVEAMDGATLTAEFESTIVTVTVAADGDGAVFPSGTLSLVVGSEYSFQANPNVSSAFEHWSINGSNIGTDNPLTLTAAADMDGAIIKAHFKKGNTNTAILIIGGVVAVGVGLALHSRKKGK